LIHGDSPTSQKQGGWVMDHLALCEKKFFFQKDNFDNFFEQKKSPTMKLGLIKIP
jgi:hypothetical protein